ncbi:MAG: glycosyltransferase [Tindallia sp. MSAO_Bac2]|nr:MAG: glycosyltransferase [Tindallia sp. MSAO_Bac2]
MKPIDIMGVPIHPVDEGEVKRLIEDYLKSHETQSIMTPNPEMVMEAQKNTKLMEALKRSDLVIPDGIGLIIVSKVKKKGLMQRVTGIDTMEQILNVSNEKKQKVFLLGGKPGVASEAADKIRDMHKGIGIAGSHHGYFSDSETDRILKTIHNASPDVLLVGLGFPRQEIWIHDNRHRLPCKIVMGIGGSLDVYAGKVKRAPAAFQRIGLEWLYRLLKEPWRIKRMAVLPQFLWKALWKL